MTTHLQRLPHFHRDTERRVVRLPPRMDYALPRLRTKFGERAFSHAGPATSNALPDNVRTVTDPVKFRKLLKSHYFRTTFSVC